MEKYLFSPLGAVARKVAAAAAGGINYEHATGSLNARGARTLFARAELETLVAVGARAR